MEQYIKICPKCTSTKITCDNIGPNPVDKCSKCGFNIMGEFPKIKKSQIEKFKKQSKTKPSSTETQ